MQEALGARESLQQELVGQMTRQPLGLPLRRSKSDLTWFLLLTSSLFHLEGLN